MAQRKTARHADDSASAPPMRLVAVMVLSGMIVGAIIAPEPSGSVEGSTITIAEESVAILD